MHMWASPVCILHLPNILRSTTIFLKLSFFSCSLGSFLKFLKHTTQVFSEDSIFSYRLVRKSNHPFLVLKGVTELSFLVLKKISGNS
jgi:hypothetical protein